MNVCSVRIFRHAVITASVMATLVVLSPRLSGAETGRSQMDAAVAATLEARKLSKNGQHAEAAAAYTKAYELYPQPKLLRKVAASLEKASVSDQKYCADAEAAWRRFLRVCGDCKKRPLALRKIDEVTARCAEYRAAKTQIQPVTEQPAQSDTGGEVVERTSATSWALAGIGIVTVMSGVGLHLSAASTAEDISRSDRVKYDRDVDLIESRERLAWTCYGVGAALGIAAAFLMPDKPAVSLSVRPNGHMVWGWQF